MDTDSRGVKRGICTNCPNCAGFRRNMGGSNSCEVCQCAPGKHQAANNITKPDTEHVFSESPGDKLTGPAQLASKLAELRFNGDSEALTEPVATKCKYCNDDVYFDINTGIEHQYCEYHLDNVPVTTGGTVAVVNIGQYGVSSPGAVAVGPSLPLLPVTRTPISLSRSIPVTTGGAVAVVNIGQYGVSSPGAVAVGPSLPLLPVTRTPISLSRSIHASTAVCAIDECGEPRYVDPNGKVHECCGYTHAMELIRRKIIEGTKQSIVKGVTHCLLPTCNAVTWPFENYCRKTHADVGKKLGLKPPAQPSLRRSTPATASLYQLPNMKETTRSEVGASAPRTTSMCLLEGCRKQKCKKTDGTGTFYDYCSLAHAEAAASSAKTSVTKDDSVCIIPECTRLKFVDPDTKEMSDFCTKRHVAEGRTRGLPIQTILTSMKDVKKFLKQFSGSLNVVELKENDHAKPGRALYKKFISARDQLPVTDRKTCLAFHGSSDQNIDSICANGYDSSKRSGQALGPGEYFATTPSTPISYCHGGKRLLLNELLLGQNTTHHTRHGDVIVMKNSEHDLPRFVITFR